MKVFLTGPTGQLGGAIADVLITKGHDIVGLARDEDAAATLQARDIEAVVGDLADVPRVAAQAAKADGVIHVAVTGDERQAEVDVAVTTAMLDALAGSGSPYVHTSGGWVLGNTGAKPADEDAPIAVAEAISSQLTHIAHEEGFDGRVQISADPTLKDADCRIEWRGGGAERAESTIEAAIADLIARRFANHTTEEQSDAGR